MGYRVKEMRELKRMTQEELAKLSGVSRATISDIENGSSRARSTSTLIAIARALGTTIDQIFLMKTLNRFDARARRKH